MKRIFSPVIKITLTNFFRPFLIAVFAHVFLLTALVWWNEQNEPANFLYQPAFIQTGLVLINAPQNISGAPQAKIEPQDANPKKKMPPKKVISSPKKNHQNIRRTAKKISGPATSLASNAKTSSAPVGTSSSLGQKLIRPHPILLNQGGLEATYPERARRLLVEGVVKLRLKISASGQVIETIIMSGPGFGLRTAALAVAKKLKFLPATNEIGQYRDAFVEHEVVFRLNKNS